MAQKKGLIYRLTMGKDDQPDFEVSRLPGTRWAVFKDVFRNRLGALVKLNLLVLLFCLPAIAWFVIVSMLKTVDSSLLPYSGNIGLGYPVVSGVTELGEYRAFSFDMMMWLVMIPLIMIASIGLSGAFYVMKRLAWGEGISVGSHFFRGIKMNFLPFLWSSLFIGVSLFVLMFNFGSYNNFMDIPDALKIVGIAVSIIAFAMLLMMMMFLTTQAVTYKLRVWALIKNSFLFAVALLPQNIFFLALSAIPVLLMIFLPQMISMFIIILFVFVGFSYIILLWTVYAHYAFDKFLNDKIEGAVKDKGIYRKTPEQQKAKEEREKKARNVRFNNPKKKKKVSSIEEGSTFTPLSATFSRADLQKLEQEKEAVKREIDAEYEDVDGLPSGEKKRSADNAPTAAKTETPSKSAAIKQIEDAEKSKSESQAEKPESDAGNQNVGKDKVNAKSDGEDKA